MQVKTAVAALRIGDLMIAFGLGAACAEFAVRWMGWEGPTTVSMVGGLIAIAGLALDTYARRATRRALRSDS